MPQLATLVLKDRTPVTPVDHIFVPKDIVDGIGTVVESTGVPVGDNRVAISLRQTPNGSYKGTVRLTLPEVQNQTINGITSPIVVRTAYAEATFTFAQSSTEQERTNAVGMLADALATSKAVVNDTIVKLQGVY